MIESMNSTRHLRKHITAEVMGISFLAMGTEVAVSAIPESRPLTVLAGSALALAGASIAYCTGISIKHELSPKDTTQIAPGGMDT